MSSLLRRLLDGPQPPELLPIPTDHVLQVVWDHDLPRVEFTCRAPETAQCRMRPADGRDRWNTADTDLTPGHRCWVEEWIEVAGLDYVELVGAPRVLAEIPVPHVFFDQGPVMDFRTGGDAA